VTENNHFVRIDEAEPLECQERLAIPVQFGLEVHVTSRTAFAVALAGLVDSHRHEPMVSELVNDPDVGPGPAGDALDREGAEALDHKECRMFLVVIRPGHDRP
jgi:hypothetical protein